MLKTVSYPYPCPDNNITCHPLTITLDPGSWFIELWGAGASNGGGYTAGILPLYHKLTVYAYLGGQEMPTGDNAGYGGYNGGGNSTKIGKFNNIYRQAGGSGATDIRLTIGSYESRIMVAGGAGGGISCSPYSREAGHGGGLIGGAGSYYPDIPTPDSPGQGGTQSDGGTGQTKGGFGDGASSSPSQNTDCAGAGGGGYYGGGSGYHNEYTGSGGGGSSYISGYDGCEIHKSKLTFRYPKMIPGNELVPNPNGKDMIHYIGQGFMRITRLGYYCSCFRNKMLTLRFVCVLTFTSFHT